jgi:hypothetical protein
MVGREISHYLSMWTRREVLNTVGASRVAVWGGRERPFGYLFACN